MPGPSDVSELVRTAAAEHPDKLAVVEAGGRSLTWSELEEEVARVATGLGSLGVVGGHRVMLVAGNRLEFVTTYLGVLRAQAVAVPVDPRSEPEQLSRMLADSGARVVLADPDTVGRVRQAIGAAAGPEAGPAALVVVVGSAPEPGERSYDDLRALAPRPVPPIPDPEKLAALLYTSGTSGPPRAAMLTHRALLANVEQVAAVRPPMIHGDDVVLGVLPLFHVYGLGAVLGGVLRHRAKLVLVDHFDPEETLALIEDEACSVLPVAPPVVARWLESAHLEDYLGPVRLVLSGAATLSAGLVEQFSARTGVPVHQGYGLTEAAPAVTSTLSSTAPEPGSLGAPLPGVEVRLVDETGRPPETGDVGDIQIRGENLFSGYWPDGADGPDADGWWATGDVGFFDDRGDLHLVDRREDVVTVSGFPVYPAEVERVVAEVDGVADVAVIGVDDPDTGQAVVAYVRASGAEPHRLADAVRRHCEGMLAGFKRPTRIEVVDRLPRSTTGMVQRSRLRVVERRRRLGILE